ncbi:ABC transporter ATP-binding protein [Bifidobacterium mongoliense]|uniref:ABC transporter ATP-binding protein n=1 Tax=Bifidobacterium mongoliense TaxID=518643 RepID=A0A423UFX7_9BIFI|nr:ATP-binding cassette domain-containing protein [Bifidobacterium mongoliense]ROT87605.1 ABC transporter ATP-binding protein [Bifidobacterium mongoliense]
MGKATTILVGVALVLSGNIGFVTYIMFLLAASIIYMPMSTMFESTTELLLIGTHTARLREINNEPIQAGSSDFHPQGHDIAFDDVTFSYESEKTGVSAGAGSAKTVLNGVSLVAKQGEVTALVGPSGSGKSTVSKLAARFWDPGSGTVTVGGVDIDTIAPETLLTDYSVVFQDVLLFNDTVMQNIRLGRRDATDEEVLAAARAANCDEFIARLPNGYHTKIGENGSTLSGGERQRISIARALLKNAPIVLLDEATASLDAENETKVQQALSRLLTGKTVLIIAHRMRTVAQADKIVVLDEGRVAEGGSPKELMAQNGIFAHMATLQNQSQRWTLK